MSARTTVAPETQTKPEILNKRELLKVLTAFRRGDFSVRLSVEGNGTDEKIAETLNEIIELNEKMVREFGRISNAVGKEGRINQRANLGNHGGGWGACVDSINTLIGDV